MAEIFGNNAGSVLSGVVLATDTQVTVSAGHGSKFESPTGSEWQTVVMVKKSTGDYEIARVTSRAGDVLNFGVIGNRGLEGTAALALAANDIIEARPTAAFFASMATTAKIQDGATNYAADIGTANVHAITLSPVPSGYGAGNFFWFKALNTNTGAATLNVNGLGAKAIKKNVNEDLSAGDIQAGGIVCVVYDGTNFQLVGQPTDPLVLLEQASDPAAQANKAIIYSKDVAGVTEAFARLSDSTILHLGFPKGTKLPFYNATVPIGWVQDATITATQAMRVVANGTAGGTNGGSHDPILNDKVPTHTHAFTTDSGGTHTHSLNSNGSWQETGGSTFGPIMSNGDVSNSTLTGGVANSAGAHTHAGTTAAPGAPSNWTPRYVDVMIGERQ